MLLQPLVENALKHGLEPKVEGGEVRVSAREEGDRLVLEVADTGLGSANGATGGTGVGPRQRARAPRCGLRRGEIRSRRESRRRLHGDAQHSAMKAILADDEPLLSLSLKTALAQAWPELEIVAVVPNGLEAVQAAERLRPDFAFLDIQMPGLTGLEAAAEIAERMGDAAPAVVFVTAYDEFATKAFELAAADYVLKPVSQGRLASTVARLKAKQQGLEELARSFAPAPRLAARRADAHAGARGRGQHGEADPDRGCVLFPVERQVHDRGDPGRRGPAAHAVEGTRWAASRRPFPADPSRNRRQPCGRLCCSAR